MPAKPSASSATEIQRVRCIGSQLEQGGGTHTSAGRCDSAAGLPLRSSSGRRLEAIDDVCRDSGGPTGACGMRDGSPGSAAAAVAQLKGTCGAATGRCLSTPEAVTQ